VSRTRTGSTGATGPPPPPNNGTFLDTGFEVLDADDVTSPLTWCRENVWGSDGHKHHRCELQLHGFVDRFDTLHQRVQEVYGPDLVSAWVSLFVGANIAEIIIAHYLNGDWMAIAAINS